MGRIGLETAEHRVVAQWLDWQHWITWCHVPSGGQRGTREQAMRTGRYLKSLGCKPGVPDIMIFSPPPKLDKIGMAIEMKAGKTRVTQEQLAFMLNLRACGWETLVARSASDAIDALENAGYGKRRNG